MKKARLLIVTVSVGVFMVPLTAVAEEPTVPLEQPPVPRTIDSMSMGMTVEGLSSEELSPDNGGGGFGTNEQEFWIAANEFSQVDGFAAYSYHSWHSYYLESGDNRFIFAQIDLPAGSYMDRLGCIVYDADATANVSWTLMRNHIDWPSKTPQSSESIANTTTNTSTGWRELWTTVDHTVFLREGNDRNNFMLRVGLDNGNSDIRLWACRLYWERTVSPAPAVATFADVPTDHWAFRFIEALADSGITGGCGGGNYCPDDPLNRGQMAVFLSAALGLYYPY
jgi:hypothetical protein